MIVRLANCHVVCKKSSHQVLSLSSAYFDTSSIFSPASSVSSCHYTSSIGAYPVGVLLPRWVSCLASPALVDLTLSPTSSLIRARHRSSPLGLTLVPSSVEDKRDWDSAAAYTSGNH